MTQVPGVSVVITAHNAAGTIADCLRALARQEGVAAGTVEIVVVDDRSDDGTADVAAEAGGPGVRILRVSGEPDVPWTTRQVALDVGIRHTAAPVVCLLDADACPDPGWLRFTLDGLQASHADVWTAPVRFQGPHWWLPAFQTVDAAFYLTWCRCLTRIGLAAGMLFGNAAFTRRAHDTIGGVGACGLALNEDLAFARATHHAGLRLAFGRRALVSVSAAGSLGAFVTRALRTSAGGPSVLLASLSAWLLALPLLATAAWTTGAPVWIGACVARAVAGIGLTITAARRAGTGADSHVIMAVCYESIVLVLGAAVLGAARVRRRVTWGGRQYPR